MLNPDVNVPKMIKYLNDFNLPVPNEITQDKMDAMVNLWLAIEKYRMTVSL